MVWIRLTAALLVLSVSLAAHTPRKTVAIVAAASMRPALDEVKAAYKEAHADVRLQISYGASGSLTAQIRQRAPVDVFLSADLGFP
jgi:molybdate transport system substrate-binding protein